MEDKNVDSTDSIQKSVADKKITNKKDLLVYVFFMALTIILVAASVYGYRYMQKLDKNISSAEETNRELNDKINKIQEVVNYNNTRVENLALAQTNAVQNNYTYPAPVYTDITIEGVIEDKNMALEEGFRFIVLDIKLENKTQNDLYYSTSELKLKDTDNFEYPFYGQGAFTEDYVKKDSKIILPGNRIPMSYATLRPGEVVKGSAVFIVNKPGKQYSLIRNGELLKNISL